MSLNTKSIIREELHRQIYDESDNSVNQGHDSLYNIESLNKGQNILSALQQNLLELSQMESKLNFMVREVKASLRSK